MNKMEIIKTDMQHRFNVQIHGDSYVNKFNGLIVRGMIRLNGRISLNINCLTYAQFSHLMRELEMMEKE